MYLCGQKRYVPALFGLSSKRYLLWTKEVPTDFVRAVLSEVLVVDREVLVVDREVFVVDREVSAVIEKRYVPILCRRVLREVLYCGQKRYVPTLLGLC